MSDPSSRRGRRPLGMTKWAGLTCRKLRAGNSLYAVIPNASEGSDEEEFHSSPNMGSVSRVIGGLYRWVADKRAKPFGR